nr:MAG TPA: hypothetical protein [Crassvirales sp.]
MELWIRSQDKEVLTRVVDIWKDADKNEIWSKSSFATKNCLGIYKTKERAIEVLDEIEYILKPKYILNTSSIKPDGDFYEENGMIFQKYNANARIEELSTFVYEMPKE